MTRGRACTALLLCTLALPGCGAGYIVRAAYEEARLLWRRQPIAEVLAGDIDADTRAKLLLTLDVRRFARDSLGLAAGGSYRTLATVDADQIVHVVTAAPRNRLVPYTWWFPIVGRVPYRAYFDPDDARDLAAELEGEGYDTYVRPAVAFSTLGWFDDPLLTTLLRYDRERLAETIIHELLHNTIYLPGQAAFNESYATFAGHRGAEAYFRARNEPEPADLAAARWADAIAFSSFLRRLTAELEATYAAGGDRDPVFQRFGQAFRSEPWKTNEYAGFVETALNNAVILHDRLYADRLALFEQAFARSAGDLRLAVEWINAAVHAAADPFAALAAALAEPAAEPSSRSATGVDRPPPLT